jgi:pyruvate/2-oxoglutarate/acetoin dehydrogenase E1 component
MSAAATHTPEHLLVTMLAKEMRANPKIVLIHGDEGAHPNGGGGSAFHELRGKFSAERVRHTAASAGALVSAALGAALCGYRPVVELSSPDDLPFALDSLATSASRSSWMSGGGITAPLVLRILTGPGMGGSHAWEAWCAHVPGLLVAAPSLASDACGLLRTALRSNDSPVLLFEHPELYTVTPDTAVAVPDLPFGVARIVRRGKDLTVVGYGSVIRKAAAACEKAAAQAGIEAELIDLRTLTPVDLVCVLESLKKTGRILLTADAPASGGFTSELAMRIMEHGFDELDAPIRRECALDIPVCTPAALPSEAAILKAIETLAQA